MAKKKRGRPKGKGKKLGPMSQGHKMKIAKGLKAYHKTCKKRKKK